MVREAAGWPEGIFPRLLRDGAQPGWFSAWMSSALQHFLSCCCCCRMSEGRSHSLYEGFDHINPQCAPLLSYYLDLTERYPLIINWE